MGTTFAVVYANIHMIFIEWNIVYSFKLSLLLSLAQPPAHGTAARASSPPRASSRSHVAPHEDEGRVQTRSRTSIWRACARVRMSHHTKMNCVETISLHIHPHHMNEVADLVSSRLTRYGSRHSCWAQLGPTKILWSQACW